jgi:hypothetical protein
MDKKKLPSFLYLVELSDESEPFKKDEYDGFEFRYKVSINEKLIKLTSGGAFSVMYFEEKTLRDMALCESLSEHIQSMMEIIADQMRLGPFVILTTRHIMRTLEPSLDCSPFIRKYSIIPFRPELAESFLEYHVGMPNHLTDMGDYHQKDYLRVVFFQNLSETLEKVPA